MLNLTSILPDLSGINPTPALRAPGLSGPLITIIILILILLLLMLYLLKPEPNKFPGYSKYTFKFYGLKNESMYKFLLDLFKNKKWTNNFNNTNNILVVIKTL
jgi:hypothetical protein